MMLQRKCLRLLIAGIFLSVLSLNWMMTTAQAADKNVLYVYEDAKKPQYVWHPTGFMPDGSGISFTDQFTENCQSGKTCIKIGADHRKHNWVGMYWLPEPGKWDGPGVNIYKKLGTDKNAPIVLSFRARGKQGGETVQFYVGGIRKRSKPVLTRWLTLNKEWTHYVIDLSYYDLTKVIGGFGWITNKERNPRKWSVQFYLDDVRYIQRDESMPPASNEEPPIVKSILESKYHLVQSFGDVAYRNTNFYKSDYHGLVLSMENRVVFPRFSEFIDAPIPLPDIFLTGIFKRLTDLDWEDRLDYGIGVEWRPFSQAKFLDTPVLHWIKLLKFYIVYLRTIYLQYQDEWSWRPKDDVRAGVEFYHEYHLDDSSRYWAEVWGDASWRITNFYVDDYDSWTFAIVPKFGVKLFPDRAYSVMPYFTGELALTGRTEYWQNRTLAGVGIRMMPFRRYDGMLGIFTKNTKFYVEYLRVTHYFDDLPSCSACVPEHDIRFGINYALNW